MRLDDHAVAVWTAALDGQGTLDCLSAGERARAALAVDPVVRRRRIDSRSVLRRVLGAYVGAAPAELLLATDAQGKPRLADGPHFNLSHSGDLMMLAVSNAGPLGIDLDRCGRLDGDWEAVTRKTFSAGERAQLLAMPEPDRPAAALRGWVRKEAYAKARGAGFAYGFTAFTVALAAEIGASGLCEDAHDSGAAAAWTLRDLVAPAGFAASLAHPGGARAVDYHALEDLPS